MLNEDEWTVYLVWIVVERQSSRQQICDSELEKLENLKHKILSSQISDMFKLNCKIKIKKE